MANEDIVGGGHDGIKSSIHKGGTANVSVYAVQEPLLELLSKLESNNSADREEVKSAFAVRSVCDRLAFA
jgi:hypothetical protein